MKKFSIVFLTYLFSVYCLSFSAIGVTVTFTQNFKGGKYPEGGHPSNKDHYNTFSFTLNIKGYDTNRYYSVNASLSSSKYKGYAANFGTTTAADLQFHAADNPGWTSVTTTSLGYTYGTVSLLQSFPDTITVRCYDWGAQGSVTVTVSETDYYGDYPRSVARPKTHRIPLDDNLNGIADGWETVETLKVVLNANRGPGEAERKGYDPSADGEIAPDAKNKNPGDGWSNYGEWRGIFETSQDEKVTRLNVEEKDVLYCSSTDMKVYKLGNTPSFKKHSYYELEDSSPFVNDPWGEVFNGSLLAEDISEDTGRVNLNSKGGNGWDEVPGYKPVWAIRIAKGSEDDNTRNRFGQTSGGSPSQYTLIWIFVDRINSVVDEAYTDAQNKYNEQGRVQYAAMAKKETNVSKKNAYNKLAKTWVWSKGTAANIKDAKEYRIKNTLAHEVLHDHNINSHCAHLLCYMNDPRLVTRKYQIDPGTGKLVIKVGRITKSLSLHSSHKPNLAVTEHPNAGVAVNNSDDPITFGEITAEMLGIDTSDDTTSTSPSNTSLSYSLVSSDGVYTATAGFGHEANFTTSRPYSYVYWYVTPPDGTESGVNTEYGDGSKTTSQLGYSFPSGVSGDYLFKAYVYDGDNTTVYEASYTVSVSLPSVSAPVWRDIPDPDNLTVGDYFYLVFSNYVSGSPTITWDSGTQPAGTTFSDGMLMGEVSQVESCYFRVKATNSAGSAYSEWISITISAPVWKPKKPDAPTGLSVSAGATAGTVDFSWTAPADNGSPITDYKVAYGSYNNGWGG